MSDHWRTIEEKKERLIELLEIRISLCDDQQRFLRNWLILLFFLFSVPIGLGILFLIQYEFLSSTLQFFAAAIIWHLFCSNMDDLKRIRKEKQEAKEIYKEVKK